MFTAVKKWFIKEKTYECIVFDGEKMSYPSLTDKQINEIKTLPQYKNWVVRLK